MKALDKTIGGGVSLRRINKKLFLLYKRSDCLKQIINADMIFIIFIKIGGK